MKGGYPLTSNELMRTMIKQWLSPSPKRLEQLRTELASKPYYYLVAAPETTQSAYECKKFLAFIESRHLLVFLSSEEASIFARRYGCLTETDQTMVLKYEPEDFLNIVSDYKERNLIKYIKFYSKVPINSVFTPRDFINKKTAYAHLSDRKLEGIDEVRTVLDTFDSSQRRKLDRGGRYENIHTLVDDLCCKNQIDSADLDNTLLLPQGFTQNFRLNAADSKSTQEVLVKYLTFLGLREYLYIYQANCTELLTALKCHPQIDTQKLKYPPSPTAERFKLEQITRGNNDGFYIYRLSMTSREGASETLIVSQPLNPPLIVGREYQLLDKDGKPRKEDSAPPNAVSKTQLPSPEEMLQMVEAIEKKDRAPSSDKSTANHRTPDEVRKDDIIRYFKRTEGINAQSAEAKYKALEVEPDILSEFHKYITDKQFGKIEIQGYTAQRLIKDLHLKPYEAFLALIQLRTDPRPTKQRLKYRESDPQYQQKRKGSTP